MMVAPRTPGAGVRKPPREETAGATCGSKSQRLDELAIGLASPPARINVRQASRPPERQLAGRSRKMVV